MNEVYFNPFLIVLGNYDKHSHLSSLFLVSGSLCFFFVCEYFIVSPFVQKIEHTVNALLLLTFFTENILDPTPYQFLNIFPVVF